MSTQYTVRIVVEEVEGYPEDTPCFGFNTREEADLFASIHQKSWFKEFGEYMMGWTSGDSVIRYFMGDGVVRSG